MGRTAFTASAVVCVLLSLTGCEQSMRDMYYQPKYEPLEPAEELFADGRSARPLPPGTVVNRQGILAGTSSGRAGEEPPPDWAMPVVPIGPTGEPKTRPGAVPERLDRIPLPVTLELLQRGRERFDIYCAPCHSPVGDGDGMIARRGFPNPPSYHTERLRRAPVGHFYNVITHGYGAMYSYAARVAPRDRWAIVAYIRALQLSQHARLDDAPEPVRARLREGSSGE